jgi:hypothetical protein
MGGGVGEETHALPTKLQRKNRKQIAFLHQIPLDQPNLSYHAFLYL